MKVKKQTLLLIAGIVWLTAGANVTRLGIIAYKDLWSFVHFLLSAAVFAIFYGMMFRGIVKKHAARIAGYKEKKQNIFLFFDLKSYLLMAFMMSLGIGLRASGWLPQVFIAVFYTGLGIALALAGVKFVFHFFKRSRSDFSIENCMEPENDPIAISTEDLLENIGPDLPVLSKKSGE